MKYITKGYCKTCKKYYEGRGRFYCSNLCCKRDLEYQRKRSLSLKGKPAWNKGLKIKINNALEKWRASGGVVWNKGLKNVHFSPNTEFKVGDPRITGKNNHNWKGGVSYNRKERNTPEYENWRNLVYKKDKWVCQRCGKKCQSKDIVAHHLYYFSWIPELSLSVKNGVVLCRSCHLKVHQKNRSVDSLFYDIVNKPESKQFLISRYLTG